MKEEGTDTRVKKIMDIVGAIKLPVIALLVFFCLKKEITAWLLSFNQSWLAEGDELIGGFLIISLLLLTMWGLYEKWQTKKLSVGHIGWVVFAVIVYLYYRIIDNTFIFWGFYIGHFKVAYLDFVFIPLIQVFCIQRKIVKQKKETQNNGQSLLDNDEPIEKEDEDLLGYGTIIRSMLSDLSVMNLSEHSFSVGIAGEWGMGKSSFFNLFKQILGEEDYKDHTIIVEFNPRSCTDVKDIQQEFFNKFASELSKYHSGITRDMQRYQDALQLPENNFVIRLLRLLPSLTTSKSKGVINDVIKEVGKRIYVLIDDFDRLTAQEILEVMKVVDRNGDFRQTVFITAYDKEYVNNVLKNYLKHRKNDLFTDKYFNYELLLPIQPKKVLTDYIKESIGNKLKEEKGDAITIAQMQAEWDVISDSIAEKLKTLRHVKRFMNIFLSRYGRVRNDVVFADFVRVSLLRYYDINCYHALVQGKLTKGDGLISMSSQVLYRVDNIEERLRKYARWEGSHDLIFDLLSEKQNDDYELTSKYKRLRFVKSFPCYFYDYQPNGLYHRQLIVLYDAQTDDEAIECLLKLLKFNKETRKYDQTSYVAVENFLRVRPVSELRKEDDVFRLHKLLCFLNSFVGRSINLESSLYYMMGKNFAKELMNCGLISSESHYKERLEASVKNEMELRPLNMSYILLQLNDDMLGADMALNESLFTQFEIQTLSEWCQKYYLSKLEHITLQNRDSVILASRVLEKNDKGDRVVAKAAKIEFVGFISLHADEFATSVMRARKTQNKTPKLNITMVETFSPDLFFPCEGMDLFQWIKENVDNYNIAYVFNQLLKKAGQRIDIDLMPEDYDINSEDFSQVYAVVKKASDLNDEKTVLTALHNQVANSIELLVGQTGIIKEDIKEAIKRLNQKGKLTEAQANIPDIIPPFSQGDFVRIKDKEWGNVIISDSHIVNLFEILEINDNEIRLNDVEEIVSSDIIEAIPIDGNHDRKVYFDPVVVSLEGSSVMTKDYSYFMKTFNRYEDEDGNKYSDLVVEKGFHFVHEVQHWLRDQGDNGLKIYTLEY